MPSITTHDRIAGCLLGQAVGDAIAAPFESIDAYSIYRDFGGAAKIIENPPQAELCYTDDTEMMIGVAECLIRHGTLEPDTLAQICAANFDRSRGYGPGAAAIFVGMREGHRWQDLVGLGYPSGSYGNGAAMRSAPIGLMFPTNLSRVADEAAASASITHGHALGIDGAVLIASATALLMQGESFVHAEFCRRLAALARTEEFRCQLTAASGLGPDDTIPFGSGIEAQRSVVSAICCFSLNPSNYNRVVGRALSMGGDVDTVAAMAGALAGTHLGIAKVPERFLRRLETGPKGREYLAKLATQLCAMGQQD